MSKWIAAAMRIRSAMDTAGAMLTDEQALTVTALYPSWDDSAAYTVGQRVRYDNTLYKCLTAHTAQAEWNPADSPSLWAKVLTDPSGAILPWEHPDSTNPYMTGDKVTHNGRTWVSTVDDNVWEPGQYGWEEVRA